MAYDAATGTMVLFGGVGPKGSTLGGTWTWDGTTWTQQHPATSPPALNSAAMAYDAATGTVVLFGGNDARSQVSDTWTWDGTTWTKQAPATSPPGRQSASMAYDAATRTVVLFGGDSGSDVKLGDTWTWDGSTWTKQAPAISPFARASASMAYYAADGTMVLFGGASQHGDARLNATWTWDGTAWTKQALATHPLTRTEASMAYDAATRTVVLFGGVSEFAGATFRDTWTWG
jgi:hypothetical protein